MEHYRVYLRAELGKLCNEGDAEGFLRANSEEQVTRVGIAQAIEGLINQFASQDEVDTFVGNLSNHELVEVTGLCDQWRRNGISRLLRSAQHPVIMQVPIEMILLRPAEPILHSRFEELGWELIAIAQDSVVLRTPPYSRSEAGRQVAMMTCLAERADDRYRLIDGMHRAIQLVRNGDAQLNLCVVER